MEVAVATTKRTEKLDKWDEIVKHLEKRRVPVLRNPSADADVTIVLGGLFENPAMIKGKRVLAVKPTDWFSSVPPPKGWFLYRDMLKAYYEDFIDLSGLNPKRSAQRIKEYIGEIKESRSKDRDDNAL
jgi:hypothetical protein